MSVTAFTFADATVAETPEALIAWCETHGEEAGRQLLSGAFAAWFRQIGRADLAQVAEDAIERGQDATQQVSLFVGLGKIADYYHRSLARRFTFLLVGRTGVGKSSTINTLLGKKVAEVGSSVPVTTEVIAFETEIAGIPCRVVDTPGLCDGLGRDDDYVQRMHRAVGDPGVDCVWFVTPLTETRVRIDEIEAIRTITEAFGTKIWDRSVIVLSFADRLHEPGEFQQQLEVRPGPLLQAIAAARGGKPPVEVGDAIAKAIPFVSVSNRRTQTPDGAPWLSRLYLATLDRMSAEGFGPFYLSLLDRVVEAPGPGKPIAPQLIHTTTHVTVSPSIVIEPRLQKEYESTFDRQLAKGAGVEVGFIETVKAAYQAVKQVARKTVTAVKGLFSRLFG